MKWKEVSKLIQVYKGYVDGDLSYEDVQRTLHSELKFNKMKLSLDASLEQGERHINLTLPNGKTVSLGVWLNKRVHQKLDDLEVIIKHLSAVLESGQVSKLVGNRLKKILKTD